MPKRYTFSDAKRWLRKHFPLQYPVRVRLATRSDIRRAYEANYDLTPRERQLDEVGLCSFHPSGCVVLIDRACSGDAKIEHLHHEWAHLLRWHLPIEADADNEHDAIYWAIFARIKRAWNEE